MRERVPLLAGLGAMILFSFVFSAWARLHEVHAAKTVLETALSAVTTGYFTLPTSVTTHAGETIGAI